MTRRCSAPSCARCRREMVQLLAAKDNSKIAWDTIKTTRVGVDHVREARRQKLCKDFDHLEFKRGESIDDFSLRASSIVTELQSLGDTTTGLDGVSKILRVVPARYAQMACYIETLLDLKGLSIDELNGRLAVSRQGQLPRWRRLVQGRSMPLLQEEGALCTGVPQEEGREGADAPCPGRG